MKEYTVSCHVLNSNSGLPLSNILCELYTITDENPIKIAKQVTNKDGRVIKDTWEFLNDHKISQNNTYMIRFQVKTSYYDIVKENTLYPYIDIPFIDRKSVV